MLIPKYLRVCVFCCKSALQSLITCDADCDLRLNVMCMCLGVKQTWVLTEGKARLSLWLDGDETFFVCLFTHILLTL